MKIYRMFVIFPDLHLRSTLFTCFHMSHLVSLTPNGFSIKRKCEEKKEFFVYFLSNKKIS